MSTKNLNEEMIEEREYTEEETQSQVMMFEKDIIAGLIAAADYKTEEQQKIEIIRNGKLYFSFTIRPLSEDEYNQCRKKHTKYVKNKRLGITVEQDVNTVKYRDALIYQATIDSDRETLWGNKKVWNSLSEKGIQIVSPLDVIEFTLRSGEKGKIIDAIDKLSGYDENDMEEVVKN